MKILFIVLLSCVYCSSVLSETVVRMELQQGLTLKNVDIKLFNSAAPDTVNSFLQYTDILPVANPPAEPTESYANSFIHNVISGSFLEGGKFTFTVPNLGEGGFVCTNCLDRESEQDPAPGDFVFPGELQRVTLNAGMPLEFKKSNVRGTIAMSKSVFADPTVEFYPDSWFVNLRDNSLFFDSISSFAQGPYTVFGEIINDSMTVLDGIETPSTTLVDRTDIHFSLGSIPLVDYTLNEPIMQDNLVRINSVEKIFTISSDIAAGDLSDTDFGIVIFDTINKAVITIQNIGANVLNIDAIANADILDLPFSISLMNNTCTGATLTTGSSCSFVAEFTSAIDDAFSDSFNIDFTFGDGVGLEKQALSYTYSLSARSVSVLQPFIEASLETVNYGSVLVDSEGVQAQLNISNIGSQDLEFTAVSIIGTDVAEFSLTDDCSTVSPLVVDAACEIFVTFLPVSFGEKNAFLSINSNAGNKPVFQIPLTGYGDSDSDGITQQVEDASPNNGDNNGDGILDSIQDNVVSFKTNSDAYITVVVEEGFNLFNIALIPEGNVSEFPEGANFNNGVIAYEVFLTQPGISIYIGVVLPAGLSPEAYYLFGSTTDNITPHWYEYGGVQLLNNADIFSADGSKLTRNLIKLVATDGGAGDNDGVVNGRIAFGPGAPSFPANSESSDSSGSFNALLLILLSLLIINRRAININRKSYF